MVRNSELNAARRGAADKARARQQVRSQMTGTLVGIDPEDSRRVIVSFDGSEVSVLAGPDKLVPGSLVAVEVDALGAPVRVVGAVTVRPVGLDEAAPAPLPVVAMPELAAREMTEAERLAIIETEQGLADARDDLEDARVEAETNFGTLNDKLGQAFPTDIFDVGAALGAVEVDVLAQAALDAQGMATAAQQAAITAAQDFAAGKISEAELRAATDAQTKANAARDAAIEAAGLDATSKAGQALTGAKTYAEQQAQAAQAAAALDAQAVALAAQQAAIEAAAEHADLVAQGASQSAIDAAAQDAQDKADAAQAAAKAHAEAQAAAAETAAKTHATNEAARVKQEALSEAATDALSKANAAASAAQTAAEQYALAQAEGKAGEALTAAKAHAEAQAQAAQEAAETAAEAYADARKNEAIDAAALTAQTKADAARDAAITAAATDAQTKADAAASAAQSAAEAYALAQAQGLSGQALADAKADATAKAEAAEQAAKDAAAADATAKANAAQQAAIAQAVGDNLIANGQMASDVAWETGTWHASGGPNGMPYMSFTGGTRRVHEPAYRITTLSPGDWVEISLWLKADKPDSRLYVEFRAGGGSQAFDIVREVEPTADVAHSPYILAGREAVPTVWTKYILRGHIAPDSEPGYYLASWFFNHTTGTERGAEVSVANVTMRRLSPEALEAQETASQAMTTADGKNTTTYKDVTTTPGPAPTNEVEGKNRRQFDMHRNRLSDGTIVGEWMWSGTSWVQVHMGDGILRSLDVGKLSAGTANIETAVINKLWVNGLVGRTAAFNQATIAAQNLIPGIEALASYSELTSDDWGALPFREFGINTTVPAIWLQGRKNGWIWAQIPVTAGERYRWSVDVRASVPGTVFYIQTVTANSDGSMGDLFSGWADWKRSPNVGSSGGSWPFSNAVAGTGYEPYWVEATATENGFISLYIFANHANGASNEAGYQWFRNLRMRSMTDGNMLVDGAVTARTLNVVPTNETTGGMELKPQGFRIIPGTDAAGSAGSSISMRSDEATWIDFVKSGVSTFSVGPEGNLIAQTVSAGAYEVDGTPLQELLEARALGLVSNIATISQVAPLQTTMRGLMTINFTNRTSIPRAIKVTAKLHARNREDHLKVAFYTAKSTTDEGVKATLGSTVGSATNYGTVAAGQNSIEHIQFIYNVPGETVSVLCAASTNYTSTEQQIFADNNTRMWAEDIGPWRILDPQVPDLRGGVGDGTDSLKDYTWKRTASWSRSFMNNGSSTYPYGTGRAYQGRYLAANGTLASMIGFPSMTTALNGATVKSVKVKLTNQHAYSSSGVTAYIGLHNRTSAPTSFVSSVNSATSKHFNRGQTHTITLPSSYYNGFKNGTYRGITLYINSTSSSNYGYWNGTTAEIIVDYEK